MRFWQWGQADAEHADWDQTNLLFRTPFGPWGDTISVAETDGDYFPPNTEPQPIVGKYGANDLHREMLFWILINQIKAKLGQVPVLVRADLNLHAVSTMSAGTYPLDVHRMITVWDKGDVSSDHYDKSAALTWYLDKKHIVRGQDMEATPSHTVDFVSAGTAEWVQVPITSILSRALRDNDDVRFDLVCRSTGNFVYDANPSAVFTDRPYLFVAYLFPIEFYRDDGAGNLDLSSPVTDEPGDEYYLGAVEPGQTGTAVKCHVRNYSGATQQIEIFDDHPEYNTPITRVGSSQLDYVDLADNSVSQRYTAIFYSATQFEVKAESYRDNSTSLHPQINADPTWRGDVSTDFVAPSGGLTIPAAAWQRGTALNDEYEVGVRGQTTDSGWPADSNDQIEITNDSAGSPDAAKWRPVLGHRETTRAQITVDAVTKFFPTRKVDAVDWPVGTKAFIMDATKIDEGSVNAVQVASIGTPTFSGTGNDDITISGNYNGVWTNTLRIEIDSTGGTDTFRWSKDGGTIWEASSINCSTSDILLADGIYVRWAAVTGHVLNDYWDSAVTTWGIELTGLTAGANTYNSGARIATTLPIRDLAAATFSTVDQPSGVSESQPARIYLESTVGFAASQTVFIQSPLSPDTAETRVIDSVQAGEYIDVTVSLTEDYSEGDLVTVVGVGEAAFWARPVAEVTTNEELKRLRFNARIL